MTTPGASNFGDPQNILGKLTNPNTGWSYHGARWMAPQTGRWSTPDPAVKGPDASMMLVPWNLNPYQYVGQSPTLYWDPNGADRSLFHGALADAYDRVQDRNPKRESTVNEVLDEFNSAVPLDKSVDKFTMQDGLARSIERVEKEVMIGIVSGEAMNALRTAFYALREAEGGYTVWKLGFSPRGLRIEAELGANLPKNFKTFDRFVRIPGSEKGIATSIKSINLADKTYQNAKSLLYTAKGYVNDIVKFKSASSQGVTITSDMIAKRALEIVVPEAATAAQRAALDEAVAYGSSKGVSVMVLTTP